MARRVIDSPSDHIAKSDPSDTELVTRALLRKAEEARANIAKLYTMVMRHEITKQPLIPAPHHLLMFGFIMHHHWCVVRMPIGTGKTFGVATVTLFLLGGDVTQRGAVVSRARSQSQKVLGMVKDYIEEPSLNAPLVLVYPWLQRSPRAQDQWTQTAITVDREPGIRDTSLVAVGLDGKIGGSRLSWLVSDDIIDDENTNTPPKRELVQSLFDVRLVSRLDPTGSRAVVTNTPWHREDLTYHLELEAGWPTLTMDIYGFIRVSNADAAWMDAALIEHLRPSRTRVGGPYDWYRLKAYDPDPEEETPLWPERYSAERIRELRYGKDGKGGMLPHEFARLFLCDPFDETASRCKREWVERCKQRGIGMSFEEKYDGRNPTYTGLDLGVGSKSKHDKTAFFTFEVQDDNSRRVLDIESGRMSGPRILDKIADKTKRFKSALAVENNAAQDYIRQFALEKQKDLKVHAHTTTQANKLNLDFGVESVFTELRNGAWIIPCERNGKCHPEVQQWIDDMIYYQPPPAHTGDHLMACWVGREAARRSCFNDPPPRVGRRREMADTGAF